MTEVRESGTEAAPQETQAGPWFDERLRGALEALLYTSPRPLTAKQVAARLGVREPEALRLLGSYRDALLAPGRGLQLRELAGGWRLEAKPEHENLLRTSPQEPRAERPLSASALEALAVVALRQPVSTGEVSAVRGADSSAALATLHRRGLIARVRGSAQTTSALWRTTRLFLDRFGLASLAELHGAGRLEKLFRSDLDI